jgi:hypothetical protein
MDPTAEDINAAFASSSGYGANGNNNFGSNNGVQVTREPARVTPDIKGIQAVYRWSYRNKEGETFEVEVGNMDELELMADYMRVKCGVPLPAKPVATCPIHGEPMFEQVGKFGPFVAHKLPSGKWCNGQPPKQFGGGGYVDNGGGSNGYQPRNNNYNRGGYGN